MPEPVNMSIGRVYDFFTQIDSDSLISIAMNSVQSFKTSRGMIWHIPLPRNLHFPFAAFHRGMGDCYDYTVVMVNSDRFLACYLRGCSNPLQSIETWGYEELNGIVHFLRPSELDATNEGAGHLSSVAMPIAHIEMQRFVERTGILGLLGFRKTIVERPVVSFTNGRHRTRFLHEMGAINFPVEVHISQAELMRQACGE